MRLLGECGSPVVVGVVSIISLSTPALVFRLDAFWCSEVVLIDVRVRCGRRFPLQAARIEDCVRVKRADVGS